MGEDRLYELKYNATLAMPFWSRASDNQSNTTSSKDFTNEDLPSTTSMMPSTFPSTSAVMHPHSNTGEFEQAAVSIQQQIIVHTVINKLSDICFEKCVGNNNKLGTSLAGKDVACVHSTVMKWLDTNEFMMGRMAKRGSIGSGGAFGNFLHI